MLIPSHLTTTTRRPAHKFGGGGPKFNIGGGSQSSTPPPPPGDPSPNNWGGGREGRQRSAGSACGNRHGRQAQEPIGGHHRAFNWGGVVTYSRGGGGYGGGGGALLGRLWGFLVSDGVGCTAPHCCTHRDWGAPMQTPPPSLCVTMAVGSQRGSPVSPVTRWGQ